MPRGENISEYFDHYLSILDISEKEKDILLKLSNIIEENVDYLTDIFLKEVSEVPELRAIVDETGLSRSKVKQALLSTFKVLFSEKYNDTLNKQIYRVGLVHAANNVSSNFLICVMCRLLSEVCEIVCRGINDLYEKQIAIKALCKVFGLALALMVAGYENSLVEALGGKPKLLKTILKTYSKELLRRHSL